MQEDERGPRMYAAKSAGSAAAFRAQESLAGLQSMPLAERAAAASNPGRQKASRSGCDMIFCMQRAPLFLSPWHSAHVHYVHPALTGRWTASAGKLRLCLISV